MKAIQVNRNISPYGGIVPVLKAINKFRIPQAIRSCLGKRVTQATYGYEDIFISWILTSLCGGYRLDHITKYRKRLSFIKDLKLPSHDTLGRVMKKLATEIIEERGVTTHWKNPKETITHYNENIKLNEMLIKATKQMGALIEGRSYTIDLDATFIETDCAGAYLSYEKTRYGFNPMVCLIGSMPVFISMRNGNSSAEFKIKECLEQCLDLLAKYKIRVGKVICDAAGYNRPLMEMLHSRGIKFNIHAKLNKNFKIMTSEIETWKLWNKAELETANHFMDCELADIPYAMHGSSTKHRLIVARMPIHQTRGSLAAREKMKELATKKLLKAENRTYKLGKWKRHKNYKYKLIISNDFSKTPTELLLEYNKRGDSERKFDFMKNDFGWRLPPFMQMNENTVFLIASALANNIFRAMVTLFNKKGAQIRVNARIPDFISSFIIVVCELIKDKYIFYNTHFNYEKMM